MAEHPKAPPAPAAPANPPTFRLRLRLLTPLELEQERAGAKPTPHFASREYRILWGTESTMVDFSGAPADVRAAYAASSGKGESAPVQVPLAYYGVVGGDGTVSKDLVDERNGDTVIEIGEYKDKLPSGLTPALWAVDRIAARRHFHPLVRIPLKRFDPPPAPKDAIQVELWWRLWNLGRISAFVLPPSAPTAHDLELPPWGSTPDEVHKWEAARPYTAFKQANQLAKVQWNLVRERLESSAEVPDTDDALMKDLLLHHDRQAPSR